MSGMDELLDEAIAKAKEVGDSQLVEWLRMARGGKRAVRWYTIRLRDLEDENAKLRKQVTKLQDDWESERDYADQMEAKEQRAVAENAKLRELADAVKEFVEDTNCEDCPCRCDCDDNNRIFCVNDFSYHAFAAMRELGIEVEDA